MTHSLHRFRQQDDGVEDYVFLCTPAIGVNHTHAREKLVELLDMVLEHHPSNVNFYENDNQSRDLAEIKRNFSDSSRIRCCFDDYMKVKSLMERIKARDFGLSICISGAFHKLEQLSEDLGLPLHSVNLSCGFHGDISKLPPISILEVTSMCGHGLISSALVEKIFFDVAKNNMTPADALKEISGQCTCGIVNKTKLRRILEDKQPCLHAG